MLSLRLPELHNLCALLSRNHGQRGSLQVFGNQQRHVRAHAHAFNERAARQNIDLHALATPVTANSRPVADHRYKHSHSKPRSLIVPVGRTKFLEIQLLFCGVPALRLTVPAALGTDNQAGNCRNVNGLSGGVRKREGASA